MQAALKNKHFSVVLLSIHISALELYTITYTELHVWSLQKEHNFILLIVTYTCLIITLDLYVAHGYTSCISIMLLCVSMHVTCTSVIGKENTHWILMSDMWQCKVQGEQGNQSEGSSSVSTVQKEVQCRAQRKLNMSDGVIKLHTLEACICGACRKRGRVTPSLAEHVLSVILKHMLEGTGLQD